MRCEGDGDGGGSGGGLGDGGGGDGCGGDGGGGSRQQASLQFAVSLFFSSHNFMHFFGFCFFPLHNLVTFFWSFFLHVVSSLSAAQSFGDGAVSMSLTLFIFKISGVNRGGLGGHSAHKGGVQGLRRYIRSRGYLGRIGGQYRSRG